MTHDIVVGVDTSEASRRAVGYACDLASLPRPDSDRAAPAPTTSRHAPPGEGDSDPDARVLLCHVVPWSPFSFTTVEDNETRPARRESELAAAREQVLDPLAKVAAERGVAASTMARHGDPVDVLGDVARSSGAALVVVGRTGDSGLRNRLFGTYAAQLAQQCPVPVTVVP